MAGLLTEFLRDSTGRPFVWGECDCYWWAVSWIERARGWNFSAALRTKYRYSTARECARIVRAQGGFPAVYRELADAAGLTPAPASALSQGDVVAVRRRREDYLLGIYLGAWRVVLKAPVGIAVVQRPIALGWRV